MTSQNTSADPWLEDLFSQFPAPRIEARPEAGLIDWSLGLDDAERARARSIIEAALVKEIIEGGF